MPQNKGETQGNGSSAVCCLDISLCSEIWWLQMPPEVPTVSNTWKSLSRPWGLVPSTAMLPCLSSRYKEMIMSAKLYTKTAFLLHNSAGYRPTEGWNACLGDSSMETHGPQGHGQAYSWRSHVKGTRWPGLSQKQSQCWETGKLQSHSDPFLMFPIMMLKLLHPWWCEKPC